MEKKSPSSCKASLRKWVKEARKKLDMQVISEQLALKLCQTDEYQQAKNIMIFYPLKDEVNLLPLLKDKTKNFYLPKIKGKDLLCCSYSEGDELCESCFKTLEPTSAPSNTNPDLVIVPALAVDKQNYRLGYGGGFYDRFLVKIDCIKIVCIPKEFVVETIYPEVFDIVINKIITT